MGIYGDHVFISQGKCITCKVRHTWPEGLHKVGGSVCPDCGTPLKRTTHLVKFPVKHWPHGLMPTAKPKLDFVNCRAE